MSITPDPLTDLASVKALLRILGSAQDAVLAQVITGVSAAVARWCRRAFFLAANAVNPITEYLSGAGQTRLLLSHVPVQAPVVTGTTTAGSAVVTGMASTAYLFANQTVVSPNIPLSSYVLSVDSLTQVTLNQLALTSGSASLIFGLAVWVDGAGFSGTGAGAFGSTTRQYEGQDWVLARDLPGAGGGGSGTGFVEKINGVWIGQYRRDVGALSSYLGDGQGNIKVTYTAGLTSLPDDLKLAATQLAGKVHEEGIRRGLPPTSDAARDYAGQRLESTDDPEVATIRSVLTAYRRLIVG